MIDLRAAVAADSELVYRIKVAAFRGYIELAWGWDDAFQRDYHERYYNPANTRIITNEGVDVGYYEFAWNEGALYIHDVYILPEYQGHGIGTVVMHMVLQNAAIRNAPVRLGVLKVNPRAKAFYERLGFVAISETEKHMLMEALPTP